MDLVQPFLCRNLRRAGTYNALLALFRVIAHPWSGRITHFPAKNALYVPPLALHGIKTFCIFVQMH